MIPDETKFVCCRMCQQLKGRITMLIFPKSTLCNTLKPWMYLNTNLCRFPKWGSGPLTLGVDVPHIQFLEWVFDHSIANASFLSFFICFLSPYRRQNFGQINNKHGDEIRTWEKINCESFVKSVRITAWKYNLTFLRVQSHQHVRISHSQTTNMEEAYSKRNKVKEDNLSLAQNMWANKGQDRWRWTYKNNFKWWTI